MSEILLTKNADKVISVIYKEYNARIKNNISKSKAKYFQSDEIDLLFNNDDISDELYELENNHLINTWITGEVLIEPSGIAYSENKIPKMIDKVIDTATKFIP